MAAPRKSLWREDTARFGRPEELSMPPLKHLLEDAAHALWKSFASGLPSRPSGAYID